MRSSLFILSLFVVQADVGVCSSSTGTADTNASDTVGWVPDPNGRGTLSLLISCVLTLGLCVWTAVHLNVSPENETHMREYYRHSKWLFLGIFGPELLLFAAWRQWNSAKAMVCAHRDVYSTPGKADIETSDREKGMIPGPARKHAWTMVHGFYGSMGGFTFEIDEKLSPFIPGYSQLTLTARGVALLAQCGHAPDISREEIKDKSKADGLAKSLVCLQAVWMLMQIIGRVVAKLPVSLLEINVMGHVVCALGIYVLWWYKPLAIRQSTRLRGEWTRPLVAYMFMSSRLSGRDRYQHQLFRFARAEPELRSLRFRAPSAETKHPKTVVDEVESRRNGRPDIRDCYAKSEGFKYDTFHPPLFAHGHFHRSTFTIQAARPPDGHADRPAGGPTQAQLLRWQLAAAAVELYPAVQGRFKSAGSSDSSEITFEPEKVEQLVILSAQDWPAEDLLRRVPSLIMGMSVWFISMAYGALHALAWKGPFPTTTEAILWRSSALYIAGSGLVWVSVNLFAKVFAGVDAYWERLNSLRGHWSELVFFGTLCFLCGLAFIFARMFLVIEAFISIRQLPAAIYQTPDWTQIFPHL
ncbi:MAG: hypothetical protein M1838_000274 [Thelocarpon superellum]|nr:MAG: hypothetical protein M1838_000274 [Thelocarpon superellum]